jgi:radical SAM enzyme (TIGR01210 family)
MCGFYAGTTAGRPLESRDYVAQFQSEVSKYNLSKFEVIGIYNAGNLLNENEIAFDAVLQITQRVASMRFKRLSIESKVEYLNLERCAQLKYVLGDTELEIAVGVESMDSIVRDLCINKPISEQKLGESVDALKSLGIRTKAYLLLKPPFLTESEAIVDFVQSVAAVNELGFDAIDCEATTIEKNTVVELLYAVGAYRSPWLWTIIEILRKSNEILDYPLYLSPFRYIVPSLEDPHNCPRCTHFVRSALLDGYSRTFSLDALSTLNCSCKEEWRSELLSKDRRSLAQRAIDAIELIEHSGTLVRSSSAGNGAQEHNNTSLVSVLRTPSWRGPRLELDRATS